MPIISYSQYATYTHCKRKYYLDYVEKKSKQDTNVYFVFGDAFGATIQEFLITMYSKSIKAANEKDWYSFLKQKMAERFLKEKDKMDKQGLNVQDFISKESMNEAYHNGIKMLDYFIKKRGDYFRKKKCSLIGVEVPVKHTVKDNIYFTGYLDIVIMDETLNEITIWECKTSRRAWNKWKYTQEKKDQTLIYKKKYSELYDVPLDKINVKFIIFKQEINEDGEWPEKRIQILEPAQSERTLNTRYNEFEKFIDGAFVFDEKKQKYIFNSVEHFTPSPSQTNCKFCQYYKTTDCPESNKVIA